MATLNRLQTSDSKTVVYSTWLPKEQVKAALLLLHGMAEHSARYQEFATLLTAEGIAVYAPDHRGHGETASANDAPLGWFATEGGWQRVVKDAHELAKHISTVHPEQPLFLAGHSMGSFLARTLIGQEPGLFAGAVIIGTGASQGLLGKVGQMIARRNAKKRGGDQPDPQLDKLSFGSYNKKIENPATTFDWLSRDAAKVQEYIDDPLCGFICTSQFYIDLIDGVTLANSPALAANLPATLPMLIISGDCDPVGNFGKGVVKVHQLYERAGIEDLTLELVSGARHEVLNETDRTETMELIRSWIAQRIGT